MIRIILIYFTVYIFVDFANRLLICLQNLQKDLRIAENSTFDNAHNFFCDLSLFQAHQSVAFLFVV